MMTNEERGRFRQRLEDKALEIKEKLHELFCELKEEWKDEIENNRYRNGNHIGDVSSGNGSVVAQSCIDKYYKLLEKIREVLARFDDGTYGICSDCGGEIDSRRMEVRPFADRCIECKRRWEKREQLEKIIAVYERGDGSYSAVGFHPHQSRRSVAE